MAYSINSSSGNLLVTVPENTINTTATSLALVGRGATNYGAAVNTNLVHLTENFASSVQPAHPLLGQTWYDSANDRLSYYKPSGWVNVRVPEDYIMANIANIAAAAGAAGGNLSSSLGNAIASITNLGDIFNDGNVAITYVLQDLRSTVNNNQSFVTTLSQTFANANIAWANTLMTLGANITSGNVTTSAGISDFYEAVATATYSLATHVETLQANYNSLESNTTALISHVDYVYASANLAIAQRIDTLLANVTTGNVTTTAGILDFASAVANATGSYGTRISGLESNVTTLTSNTSAWIRSTEQTQTTANLAIASRIDSLYASITTGNVTTSAGILDFAEAVANATSSYATQISGVTSTVGNLTSNVSTLSSSVNGISSQYGVTLNAGGHIAGFQILSGITGPSEFIINADTFKIFTDDGSKNPFSVTGGNIAMNGNVSINGNLVVAGTIFTEAIHENAVTVPLSMTSSASIGADQAMTLDISDPENPVITGYPPILSYSFTMPSIGKIMVWWQAESGGTRQCYWRIKLNGTFIGYNRAGGAFQDAPVIVAEGTGIAGTNLVEIIWEYGGGNIAVQQLIILGAQR
jgi:hypothetical protein